MTPDDDSEALSGKRNYDIWDSLEVEEVAYFQLDSRGQDVGCMTVEFSFPFYLG